MIDLCKIFGVEEGEGFRIEKCEWTENTKYVIQDNHLMVVDSDNSTYKSCAELNDLVGGEIIKLPKKKEFTDDELCILRNIDKKYKWIARDKGGTTYIHEEKPTKEGETWENVGHWCSLYTFKHLFNSIQWEDEEPVFIDDYVERGVENE